MNALAYVLGHVVVCRRCRQSAIFLAAMASVALWAAIVTAEDSHLVITQVQQVQGLYVPAEVCRITSKNEYRRGPDYAGLSCMDYFGRIVGLAAAGQKGESWMQLYFCWAMDPCGKPK